MAEQKVAASALGEPLLLPGKDQAGLADDVEAQLTSYHAGASASFSRTCLNLTNAVSGIGVLSMPYAVSQGGWLSLLLFAVVGTVCCYTGTLIERCMRADGSIASYPDIGRFAFGAVGRRAIAFFMYVELYLVAISFLVLEGDNLDKLFPGASMELLGYRLHGKQLFIVLAAAVILPTTWLKNLGMLAYVSAAGLVASAALTASLSQVTLNLPSGKLYTKIAIVTTLVNPLAKYALLVAPITAAVEEKFSLQHGGAPARAAISTAILASTVVVASTVPFFGYLMSFIGSFLSVMATVLFPCLCYLKIYKADGIRRTEMVAIAGILLLGVFVAVTGTYTSLQQIISTF
uniref:Amino acid transporter transmembrane domain-containing protein n=1 Tax=Oryza brachyantha TaxID=4533 RepID=J3L1L0_ORYBR